MEQIMNKKRTSSISSDWLITGL